MKTTLKYRFSGGINMKIAMVGSGAAGSVFAAYLRKGGAELSLVDRYKAHMDLCRERGLLFVSPRARSF